jgi:C2 domain
VNESLNPTWGQTFDFVVEDGLHDMLILEVWDHDTFGKVFFFLIYGYKVCTSDCEMPLLASHSHFSGQNLPYWLLDVLTNIVSNILGLYGKMHIDID